MMRILQLCKKFPYPPKDGESIAITFLAKALHELGHEVHLLAMNTSKHFADTDQYQSELSHYAQFGTVAVDNRVKPIDAFLNLFTDTSYHIDRFIQPDFEKELIAWVTSCSYDAIILETVYLAPYVKHIRTHSNAKIVMRAHNVEHEIWERLAENAPFLKKMYLKHITPRLRNFEIGALNTYDLFAGITQRDIQTFRSFGMTIPSVTLPVGLDIRNYQADQVSYNKPLTIGFLGSLDWMPNIEGINWFLQEVWKPFIAIQFPDLQLHIAGRNTPNWLKAESNDRIIIHGEIENAAEFMLQHTLLVVPLLSGGGMRVKILEGMALSRINITTTIGMEGIQAQDGEELLVADSPADFVKAIEFCYKNPQKMYEIGLRAQVFCAKHYDNYRLAQILLAAIKETTHLAK